MIATARRGGRIRLVAAALVAATALVLSGCSATSTDFPTGSTDSPSGSTPTGPASSRPHTPTTGMPTAVVIGDSIAIGWDVPAEDAWPLIASERLGWNLTDLGEGGAGFTRPGVNTHDFHDQVSAAIRLRPQVVIIAATRNDVATATTAPATVKTATQAAIDRLSGALPDTTIIGMGAVWGATAAPPVASVMDDALKNAVIGAGGHWLAIGQPFLGRADLMQTDGVHPNTAGQSLLGKTVADAIAKAGIEPGPASE
ncbi:SGNH/GDSL hydrolase family protein [Leifsonia sp. McL0607]|uniref:SGNH/GDSL hydrolase family protein n=1 Tax=Leifsonia sp. McL0607 TaxID=3415672 RepID=UPI003CED905A